MTVHTPPQGPLPWFAPSPLPSRLETPRLVLRYWEHSDAPAVFKAIEAGRGTLLPWLPWALTDNRSVEECLFNIERFRRDRERPGANDFVIGIFDRATGEPIGGTGFHRLKPEAQQAEIGYWVRGDRRRRGLCSEALSHLLSWGFTEQSRGGWGFRRIEIFCAGRNIASRGVPEKLGLRREVEVRDARWFEGTGWDDTLGWGVLAREWDCDQHRLRPASA